MKEYKAHLSPLLFGFSLLMTILIIGLIVHGLYKLEPFILLIGLIVVVAFFLSVKSYSLEGKQLLIKRWGGWISRIEISDLKKASMNPGLLWRSISVCSTHGFFGVVGYAYNWNIGFYHVHVTDPSKTILLKLNSGKKIAISPELPEDFLSQLSISDKG